MAQGNIVEMELSASKAKKFLLEITENSSRVFFTRHAEKRMKQRKITRPQIIRCLQSGAITEGPARGISGNWEMRMEVLSVGDPVTVVAALDNDEQGNFVIVITVIN
ncbi:MAG: hypothetical protein BMS9Abin33_0065 [Gammaproteobacteria bacterium]|nr:MAG: hypothetical protein BMS9Abin33_0065 [Gammaproteobacteria bacterium]